MMENAKMKYGWLLVCVWIACMACAVGGESIVLFDAANGKKPYLPMRNQGQNTVADELDGRPVLWLEYNRVEADVFCMGISDVVEAKEIGEFASAKITFDIFFPEEAGANWVTIRFRDKDKEICQFCLKFDPSLRGWHTLTMPIDPEKCYATWDGDVKNKKMDFPAAPVEFLVDFSEKIATGRLALARIVLEDCSD